MEVIGLKTLNGLDLVGYLEGEYDDHFLLENTLVLTYDQALDDIGRPVMSYGWLPISLAAANPQKGQTLKLYKNGILCKFEIEERYLDFYREAVTGIKVPEKSGLII